MCHGKMRRWEEHAAKEERRERLWDLFDRETKGPVPTDPVVEQAEATELEREEELTGAGRSPDDGR
jgi:Mn-dependent DtxR family transcriptional regulator